MTKIDRKFRKLTVDQRLQVLRREQCLNEEDYTLLASLRSALDIHAANRMVENVVAVFGLPQGLAVNFPLNGKIYQVPMVVEEPSVVAALSFSALLAEKCGGFQASFPDPLIYGQVPLLGFEDAAVAAQRIEAASQEILLSANALMPSMVQRGGGAKSVRARALIAPSSGAPMLVVDIGFDTRDAMGANQVNSVVEGLAPLLASLTGGRALLSILSNLADQALACAEVRFPCSVLRVNGQSGEDVRDAIIMANDFALVDPYRATTHNKGIMNGIDAVALATGNDWRSIEAAAHAYACRDGQYRALTRWEKEDNGDLRGHIELPMKVGTVGGSLMTNPAVAVNQHMLGVQSSGELAAVMAAVGLAQNFAALRALVTAGIQRGHMRLHARSVALAAKVPDEIFDKVVSTLVEENNVKLWRAKEIAEALLPPKS